MRLAEYHRRRKTDMGPTVVCVCGSMRFVEEMQRCAVEETWKQRIVLLPFVSKNEMTEEEQWRMDLLHTFKIDMADEVLIVDCNESSVEEPYVGSSTRKEIVHARNQGLRIRYRHDEYARGMVRA